MIQNSVLDKIVINDYDIDCYLYIFFYLTMQELWQLRHIERQCSRQVVVKVVSEVRDIWAKDNVGMNYGLFNGCRVVMWWSVR